MNIATLLSLLPRAVVNTFWDLLAGVVTVPSHFLLPTSPLKSVLELPPPQLFPIPLLDAAPYPSLGFTKWNATATFVEFAEPSHTLLTPTRLDTSTGIFWSILVTVLLLVYTAVLWVYILIRAEEPPRSPPSLARLYEKLTGEKYDPSHWDRVGYDTRPLRCPEKPWGGFVNPDRLNDFADLLAKYGFTDLTATQSFRRRPRKSATIMPQNDVVNIRMKAVQPRTGLSLKIHETIELYPPSAVAMDERDMFHLWDLGEGELRAFEFLDYDSHWLGFDFGFDFGFDLWSEGIWGTSQDNCATEINPGFTPGDDAQCWNVAKASNAVVLHPTIGSHNVDLEALFKTLADLNANASGWSNLASAGFALKIIVDGIANDAPPTSQRSSSGLLMIEYDEAPLDACSVPLPPDDESLEISMEELPTTPSCDASTPEVSVEEPVVIPDQQTEVTADIPDVEAIELDVTEQAALQATPQMGSMELPEDLEASALTDASVTEETLAGSGAVDEPVEPFITEAGEAVSDLDLDVSSPAVETPSAPDVPDYGDTAVKETFEVSALPEPTVLSATDADVELSTMPEVEQTPDVQVQVESEPTIFANSPTEVVPTVEKLPKATTPLDYEPAALDESLPELSDATPVSDVDAAVQTPVTSQLEEVPEMHIRPENEPIAATESVVEAVPAMDTEPATVVEPLPEPTTSLDQEPETLIDSVPELSPRTSHSEFYISDTDTESTLSVSEDMDASALCTSQELSDSIVMVDMEEPEPVCIAPTCKAPHYEHGMLLSPVPEIPEIATPLATEPPLSLSSLMDATNSDIKSHTMIYKAPVPYFRVYDDGKPMENAPTGPFTRAGPAKPFGPAPV